LIVVGIMILLIAVLIGFYLYQFHVFKTLRVCVKDESSDLLIVCDSNEFCLDFVKGKAKNYSDEDLGNLPDFIKNKIREKTNGGTALKDIFEQLENAPDFLSKMIDEVMEEIIYCDSTCRDKEFYGSAPLGEGDVDSCQPGEKEFVLEIRGKEALALSGWMAEFGIGKVVWGVG